MVLFNVCSDGSQSAASKNFSNRSHFNTKNSTKSRKNTPKNPPGEKSPPPEVGTGNDIILDSPKNSHHRGDLPLLPFKGPQKEPILFSLRA